MREVKVLNKLADNWKRLEVVNLKQLKKLAENQKALEVKKLKSLEKATENQKALQGKKLKVLKKAAFRKVKTADNMACQQQKDSLQYLRQVGQENLLNVIRLIVSVVAKVPFYNSTIIVSVVVIDY